MRKLGFCRTLPDAAAWAHAEVAAGDVADVLAPENEQEGKDRVFFAGAALARPLVRTGRVDEDWRRTDTGAGLARFDGA